MPCVIGIPAFPCLFVGGNDHSGPHATCFEHIRLAHPSSRSSESTRCGDAEVACRYPSVVVSTKRGVKLLFNSEGDQSIGVMRSFELKTIMVAASY